MTKIYVLIDVGCHECGVGSEYVASFLTEGDADKACAELGRKTSNRRDGGQSIPEVFAIEVPDILTGLNQEKV